MSSRLVVSHTLQLQPVVEASSRIMTTNVLLKTMGSQGARWRVMLNDIAHTQAAWHGAPQKMFGAPQSKIPKAPRFVPRAGAFF